MNFTFLTNCPYKYRCIGIHMALPQNDKKPLTVKPPSVMDFTDKYQRVFNDLCENGELYSATFIAWMHNISAISVRSCHRVCERGHLPVFKFLVESNLICDPHESIDAAGVISSGNLEFIKYLYEKFSDIIDTQFHKYDCGDYYHMFKRYFELYEPTDAVRIIKSICDTYIYHDDTVTLLCTYDKNTYSLIRLALELKSNELVEFCSSKVPFKQIDV